MSISAVASSPFTGSDPATIVDLLGTENCAAIRAFQTQYRDAVNEAVETLRKVEQPMQLPLAFRISISPDRGSAEIYLSSQVLNTFFNSLDGRFKPWDPVFGRFENREFSTLDHRNFIGYLAGCKKALIDYIDPVIVKAHRGVSCFSPEQHLSPYHLEVWQANVALRTLLNDAGFTSAYAHLSGEVRKAVEKEAAAQTQGPRHSSRVEAPLPDLAL